MTKWKSKILVVSGFISSTELELEESERFPDFFRFRRLSESEAEAEAPAYHKARNRTLTLVYSSASACDSDNAVSLDRKRRRQKQNQCSASDSVGLIFTKSYRSALLITTPSLVKTILKEHDFELKFSRIQHKLIQCLYLSSHSQTVFSHKKYFCWIIIWGILSGIK